MVCKWLVPGDAVEGVDYDLKVYVRVYACVCGEMVVVHGNTTLEHTRTQIHLHAH
jgi:hypothetical protein